MPPPRPEQDLDELTLADEFLQRQLNRHIKVYLENKNCLLGILRDYDNEHILTEFSGGESLITRRMIGTIVEDKE